MFNHFLYRFLTSVFSLIKSFSHIALLLTLWSVSTLEAAELRVLKTGLGSGTVSATGINCGTDCNESYADDASITLTVSPASASQFTAWGGACASITVVPPATPPCTLNMSALRSVRANFEFTTPVPPLTLPNLTPEGIQTYLSGPGINVDTPAEFVAALPQDFRENWILMTRSESLQVGTAKLPRILLIGADGLNAFTLGLAGETDASAASYPGSHANAVEYMQWDSAQRNFRFHEIILAPVPALGDVIDAGPPEVRRFSARARGVKPDDAKCFACHSTRNVMHTGGTPGTTGTPPGTVKFKSKPNWDSYDSWGGMMPFTRDRIYQDSIEAAFFRKLFNLWTWQNENGVRAVIEQLKFQPDGVSSGHAITRWHQPPLAGGLNDGHIQFGFDPVNSSGVPVVQLEQLPTGTNTSVSYAFDGIAGTSSSQVKRRDTFLTLHHPCSPGSDEGRGVDLFDVLTIGKGGTPSPSCPISGPVERPNPLRIVDELMDHRFATGSLPIDARPIALAIASSCITASGGTAIGDTQTVNGVTSSAVLNFYNARNGMNFNGVYDDTRRRAQSLTIRKADIQRKNLDRDADIYVFDPSPFDATPLAPPDRINGIIREYGAGTLGISGGTGGGDLSLARLRQEIFRRQSTGPGHPDETVMGRIFPDREDDSTDGNPDNTAPVALYRYFLEPLGVSVDKWSMGVRGRSRTYTFADLFGSYTGTFQTVLQGELSVSTCADIMPLVTAEFARLPTITGVPTYTDVQRILNKSCIECHGGLGYPPAHTYGISLDFTEDEFPPTGERRLWKSLRSMRSLAGVPSCPPGTPVCTLGTATDVSNSYVIRRITDSGNLAHPYNPTAPFNYANPDDPVNPDVADERCPAGIMPCEGPPLSKVDIETIGRWIIGGRPNTEGDPHIRTVEGVRYDFQSAGEFVLLRDETMELQTRQTAVTTAGPLRPNAYTGLSSCVSVNTAVALRVGSHRVTYQPEILVRGDDGPANNAKNVNIPRRLLLRVDGKPVNLNGQEFKLPKGGRIVPNGANEAIAIHYPGGTKVEITPAWWSSHQIWHMGINTYNARAVSGIMGVIAPGSWLPALANGDWLGAKPASLVQRHEDLYKTFADSWRVDSATSLFDYESGLNPQSFVVQDWPVSDQQQACVAPAQPGGPAANAPMPTPMNQADAESVCRGITDSARKENCVIDLMATGELSFAAAYAQADKLEQRVVIASPSLVAPEDNSVQPAKGVDFVWEPAPGAEQIDVNYRHCIWNGDELFDFNNCRKLETPSNPVLDVLPKSFIKLFSHGVCIVFMLVLLCIVIVLFVRGKPKAAFVVLLLALLVAIVCYLNGANRPVLETRVSELKPNKVYFWKVVAETQEGIAIESATYRFEVIE